MTSRDERLCMAVVKNSTVTDINWDGVAKDLGVATGNAANCQWRRFKARFSDAAPAKPAKANGRKKRAVGEMGDGSGDGSSHGDGVEETAACQQPEKKQKRKLSRNIKMETPESDSEDEDVQWGSDEDGV